MKIKYTVFNTMKEYEHDFLEQFDTEGVNLLRDIYVSREQLEEITRCIKLIYRFEETNRLRRKYPLTTSLFLVWSAVYDYKDGDFWSIIFNNLNIKNRSKYQKGLGDVFLYTISKYKRTSIDNSDGKKYLSPILMHGYISNNYAYPFFDYLNKVYTILLNYDASELNISRIWDDLFEKEIDDSSIKGEIKKIIFTINKIKKERSDYEIPDDLLNLKRSDVEKHKELVEELENSISTYEFKINELRNKVNKCITVFEYIVEIESGLISISNIESRIITYNSLENAMSLTSDTKAEIYEAIDNNEQEIKNLEKIIKKTNNQLTIEEEKVKDIQTQITTVGKGSLEDGWEDIERYKEINHEIDILKKELEERKSLIKLKRGVKNTSLKQVLTSSLEHLYKQAPDLFKEFIIDTFQAIEAISKDEELDPAYPLCDILNEWNKTYRIKEIKTSYTKGNYRFSNGKSNHNKLDSNTEENRHRLQLQSLKKPYIQYSITSSHITIKVPEQSFYYNYNMNAKPNYTLDYGHEYEEELSIQTYIDGNSIYFKELSVPIEKYSEITFKFEYFNLREEYVIDLSTIMIFDDKGNLLTNNKLTNGFYYVVCSNKWNSNYEGIIDVYPFSIKDFMVYELQLNEDKALFTSSDKSVVEYVGSDISSVSLECFNVFEGITIDNIKVSTGKLPQLLIALSDIDTTDNSMLFYLDDKLIIENRLDELLHANFVHKENLSIKINLEKLIGEKKKPHISKIETLIINKNNDDIFKESFWHLYSTQFLYINETLNIKNSYNVRIRYKEKAKNTKRAVIPLINEVGEKFSIFYNKVGWKNFNVEVPKVKYEFRDNYGDIVEVPKTLLVSQLDMLNGLYVIWKANSYIPRTIYLCDNNNIIESRLHMKDKEAFTHLYSYYDILKATEDNNSLSFKWAGLNRKSDSLSIIDIYKQWKVKNISSYATEDGDEYIIELSYNYNFLLMLKKFLRVYNDDNLIFEKEIDDDRIIIYLKKDKLKSLNIKTEIVYFDETNTIFGKAKEEVIAGIHTFKLPSKTYNLNMIKERGIKATGFKYRGKDHKFTKPFIIKNIRKTVPINFVEEELYIGEAIIEDKITTVLFYINLEDKNLPFLLDIDIDGAQYQPKTGDVFWENRKGKDIMGPIDDISYIVREE